MTTMQLITTNTSVDDTADEALAAMFEAAGLSIEVVAHCDDASCPVCFVAAPAQAA